jgi:NADPH:quinone reductase-like Zn-dependent oxidoreductase
MRAYELQPREGFDALTLVERNTREPGPNEVRVRVRAVSLNYRDLAIARLATRRKGAPIVACSDGAGEVVAVGAGVTRLRAGDRVAAIFFPDWLDGDIQASHHRRALGGTADGMLAEEVVLPEHAWVSIPAHLSFEEAATLPCAGVTAYHALFEAAHVRPGSTILVQGTGGVSIFALQLAKAAGARVVLTSRSEAKREQAKQLGADHVIDYVATPNWGDAAFEWTGGQGVDLVVEVGGPGTFDQSLAALRYNGTLAQIGALTGARGEVSTFGIFQKSLRVRGIYVGSRRMFEALNRAIATTGLQPVIDRAFAFEDARTAYDYMASGAHFGKIVIRVAADSE